MQSLAIDKHLEESARRGGSEYKILLLGAGESGKSTVVKQMKILHQDGFSPEELLVYRLGVLKNVTESAKALVRGMQLLHVAPASPANAAYFAPILAYQVEADAHATLPPELSAMIMSLWADPVIPQVMERSNEFYIMDNAPYFFDQMERICAPNYLPTEQDVLHARSKTIGVTETCFTMGKLSIRLVDVGGQRSERRKWIHCFEAVTSIIFCVALSEYDQALLEDNQQNRLSESLVLFESIVNSRTSCSLPRLVHTHLDCASPEQDRSLPRENPAAAARGLLPRIHGGCRRDQGGEVHSMALHAA